MKSIAESIRFVAMGNTPYEATGLNMGFGRIHQPRGNPPRLQWSLGRSFAS